VTAYNRGMNVMVADADGLRSSLKAAAYDALSRVGPTPPERPIVVRARSKLTEVKVVVHAIDDGERNPHRIGSWMSPTETLIVSKLGPDTLTRIDLAKRCGMPCDPKFKTLVTNLIDRGILTDANDGHGVCLAG
jgi:hypothetical protein